MRSSGWVTVLASSLVACSSGDLERGGTGLRLEANWESSITPAFLSAWAIRPQGQVTPPLEVPVQLDLAPPGLRRQNLLLEVPLPSGAEEMVEVGIDGLTEDRRMMATGAAKARVVSGGYADLSVRLVVPADCPAESTAGCEPLRPQSRPDGGVDAGEDADGGTTGGPQPASVSLESAEALELASTTSPTFVDVPGAAITLPPGSARELWLLLVSGLVGSTSGEEVAAELRVTVNGVQTDLFGHQTRGAADNAAGFLSFDLLQGNADPQTIQLQYRAQQGRTDVSQVRLVLLRVPEDADAHFMESDPVREQAGMGLPLGELVFAPSAPGDYLVFARVSQRETPSTAGARSWLELPSRAARPLDDNGVRFTNSRQAWQPVFTAARVSLDGGLATFTLRGDSSAPGNGVPWWNDGYRFRKSVSYVTPLENIPPGVSVPITFDHQTLVAQGRSQTDGADLRVVARTAAGAWLELGRSADPVRGFGRPDTTLWVTPSSAALGAGATLYLYYAQPNAGPAPLQPEGATPAPQLAATLGVEESWSGGAPSQWRNARILAFRTDVFRQAFYDESPLLTTTRTAELTSKNRLTTAAPGGPLRELVIQSMRVAGESSDVARRSGILRADEVTILETTHKMNRGTGANGYHHNAALARVVETDRAITYENALRSPDGIAVEAADSVIIVLR